jgi:hypothetical protein
MALVSACRSWAAVVVLVVAQLVRTEREKQARRCGRDANQPRAGAREEVPRRLAPLCPPYGNDTPGTPATRDGADRTKQLGRPR